MNGRTGLVQAVDGRRVLGTGTGIALITIGAILRFALPAGSPHGLNVQVVGIVLILAGMLGMVLSPLVWGPLNSGRRRDHFRRSGGEAPSVLIGDRQVYRDQPPL